LTSADIDPCGAFDPSSVSVTPEGEKGIGAALRRLIHQPICFVLGSRLNDLPK
jgi:hypothetical protein